MASQTTRDAASKAVEAAGSEPAQPTIKDLLLRNKAAIGEALPKHMTPERMARIAFDEIRNNPALAECTPVSLMAAVMKCARLGLEPGPLGHAWFVPYKNNRSNTKEVQWQLGYTGIIELFRRSGQFHSITAREVCENDQWSFDLGDDPPFHHSFDLRKPRGDVIGYYGYARFKEGGHLFVPVTLEEIEKHRKRSQARDSGPWKTDYDAMARKTVVRIMRPFLPLSSEIMSAIENEGPATDVMSDVFGVQPAEGLNDEAIDTTAVDDDQGDGENTDEGEAAGGAQPPSEEDAGPSGRDADGPPSAQQELGES